MTPTAQPQRSSAVCRKPCASADSTNAGVNCNGKRWEGPYQPATAWQRAAVIADRVEAHNSLCHWPDAAIC